MGESRIPVLLIFGPTASGKTSLAGHLFASDAPSVFAGCAEIVSADSMQVYRGMDIGTAKADAAFRQKLPHHLLDVCNPNEQFTAGEFVRHADRACKDIYARGKLPVVLGGTAFYFKNFLYGLPVTPKADSMTRKRLQDEMKRYGAALMHERLMKIDPARAEKIHVHDEYRILRALEIYEASGKPLTEFLLSQKLRDNYEFCVLALDKNREELTAHINERVVSMMQQGLANEFAALIKNGFVQSDPGMQAIGYREFFTVSERHACAPEAAPLDEVTELIQSDSRKYAKRQMTFFKTIDGASWIPACDTDAFTRAVSRFYTAHF